jgi:hypothetical protein
LREIGVCPFTEALNDAELGVAGITQQTANALPTASQFGTTAPVMIDGESLPADLIAFTDHTHAALLFKHLLVLFTSEVVTTVFLVLVIA